MDRWYDRQGLEVQRHAPGAAHLREDGVSRDEIPSHQLFADIEGPRNTREKILFSAMDLFYSDGFHAVGLDRILEEAEIAKATFYNHFRSKDELVEATIQLRDQWESEAFLRALKDKAGYDPRRLLLACFDVLEEWFTHPDYRGCLFLMAMTEYPLPHHPVHAAGARHYLVTAHEIEQMAIAAGVREPADLARAWTVLIIGAVSAHLVDRDSGSARTARELAERLLPAYLDDPPE
jgi:AcrR family transcriptional regulator